METTPWPECDDADDPSAVRFDRPERENLWWLLIFGGMMLVLLLAV